MIFYCFDIGDKSTSHISKVLLTKLNSSASQPGGTTRAKWPYCQRHVKKITNNKCIEYMEQNMSEGATLMVRQEVLECTQDKRKKTLLYWTHTQWPFLYLVCCTMLITTWDNIIWMAGQWPPDLTCWVLVTMSAYTVSILVLVVFTITETTASDCCVLNPAKSKSKANCNTQGFMLYNNDDLSTFFFLRILTTFLQETHYGVCVEKQFSVAGLHHAITCLP